MEKIFRVRCLETDKIIGHERLNNNSWEFMDYGESGGWQKGVMEVNAKREQYLGFDDQNGDGIYEGATVVKYEQDRLSDEYQEWLSYVEDDMEHDKTLENKIPVVERIRDTVTMDRMPVYWCENESFGYEGEGLYYPEDFVIVNK